MTFTDELGIWKLLGEVPLSKNSIFLTVPSTPKKIIRYSYIADWNLWDKSSSIKKTKCLVRWHYGFNRNAATYFKALYPKSISNIIEYNFISSANNLSIRELEVKFIPYRYRSYYANVEFFPWTLKIEEYQQE